MQRLQIFKRAR